MLKEIVIAFQSWQKAHLFIRRHNLRNTVLVPGFVYSALFILGMIFFWQSSAQVVAWLSEQMHIENWLQKADSNWLSFFFVMSRLMLQLTLMLFYFSLFKYIILIIGAPIFAFISNKTEALISGEPFMTTGETIKADAIRNIKLTTRNAGVQTIYFIGLIVLSLIPLIGWIAPLIALGLECYYYGVSMIDHSLARNKVPLSESIRYNSLRKGLALGNGFLFYLMHLLIVLAPSYAIVAATLSVREMQKIEQG